MFAVVSHNCVQMWLNVLRGAGLICVNVIRQKLKSDQIKKKKAACTEGLRMVGMENRCVRPAAARVPASPAAWSLEPGAAFREEHKSTQIPQKDLFWQGSGLPPTAASSSLLPSSIHLWGAAYSPRPTPHNKIWTSILRRGADVHARERLLGRDRHIQPRAHSLEPERLLWGCTPN